MLSLGLILAALIVLQLGSWTWRIPAVIVLAVVALTCFALDDCYRLARRSYRRRLARA